MDIIMVNLIYIRAAIQQKTGKVLPLNEIIDLLVDEGLITKRQAQDENLIFRGYEEFFETEEASTKVEHADQYVEKEKRYGED
jgi:hypothetical protein